jgi:hypothetical protein
MDNNQDRQMQEHDTDKISLSDITRDPITQKVINKIVHRSISGMNKFGVTMHDNPKDVDQWLLEAQEEAIDLINYLEIAIERYKKLKQKLHALMRDNG